MDTLQMLQKLQNVHVGSEVFVSYLAGRPSTPTARRQAHRAIQAGINKRHFTGTFSSVWRAKNGDICLTLKEVNERELHYRTFNPSLGTLLSLEVMS